MKRGRFFEWSLLAAVLVSVLVMVANAQSCFAHISESVLRLHVRADSDSSADQAVKLMVRDEVLKRTGGLLDGVTDRDEAAEILRENLALFEQTANETLAEHNMPYRARAVFDTEYFPTRQYGELTLPAGRYEALVVELGSAEGQNWWCVMFPTLCYTQDLVTADDGSLDYLRETLSEEEFDLVAGDAEVKTTYKFKLIEWLNDLKEPLF